MARYTGPVCRICRRFGEKLFLKNDKCLTHCTLEHRGAPPGAHARASRRRRPSEWALQLKEKQKARAIYGVLERQFRRYFEIAGRRPGLVGQNLLQILEMRLDNVAYRLGFAGSRPQARQTVLHGHIMVNERRRNVPSMPVKVGDVISWRPLSQKLTPYEKATQEAEKKLVPAWLSLDTAAMTGRVLRPPERADLEYSINEQAITAYYSR